MYSYSWWRWSTFCPKDRYIYSYFIMKEKKFHLPPTPGKVSLAQNPRLGHSINKSQTVITEGLNSPKHQMPMTDGTVYRPKRSQSCLQVTMY